MKKEAVTEKKQLNSLQRNKQVIQPTQIDLLSYVKLTVTTFLKNQNIKYPSIKSFMPN
jgi:hypothetical protein